MRRGGGEDEFALLVLLAGIISVALFERNPACVQMLLRKMEVFGIWQYEDVFFGVYRRIFSNSWNVTMLDFLGRLTACIMEPSVRI